MDTKYRPVAGIGYPLVIRPNSVRYVNPINELNRLLEQIEVLEYEVAMWRKHVPELEADLAKAKLSNKGMHKTIERLTRYHSHKVSNNDTLRKHILTEGETK